ncbi:hypothetical protein LCGC14_1057010 [marine sediment metagenome]|uniref:Uncharacterized protein n=1 Tax=marine sediment metagenome TaxID=412755 RepID=A0A0F9QT76_9ZZZZ
MKNLKFDILQQNVLIAVPARVGFLRKIIVGIVKYVKKIVVCDALLVRYVAGVSLSSRTGC